MKASCLFDVKITESIHIANMKPTKIRWVCLLSLILLIQTLILPSFASTANTEIPKVNQKTFFTAEELAWLKQHPVIKVGPDPDYAPVEFFENGGYRGISVDLLEAIETRYDLRFEYITYSTWQEVVEASRSKEIDMISAIMATESRREFLSFTKAYLVMPTKMYIREGTPQFGDLSKSKGKRIAAIRGYATTDYLTLMAPEASIVLVRDIKEGLTRLSLGEVDAFIGDSGQVVYYADDYSIENILWDSSVELDFPFNLSMGVINDEPILLSILDKILADFPKDQLDVIKSKWLINKIEKANKTGLIISLLIGLLVLTLAVSFAVLMWNRVLKNRVRIQTQQLREELEKSQIYDRQMRLLLDALPYPVFTKDAKGNFVTVNQAYADFFGTTVDQIEGINDQIIYASNPYSKAERFGVQEVPVLELHQDSHLKEQTLVDAKGASHIYDITKVPFPLAGQVDWGLLGISVDITELKSKEKERYKALNRLVANVAHQINTPLGNIISSMSYLHMFHKDYVEQIERGINSTNDLKNYLEVVGDVNQITIKAMNRIKTIVDAFESLALTKETVPPSNVNVFDLISILASNKKTTVNFDYGIHFEADITILTYQTALVEVLTRVIDNAIQHGFSGENQVGANVHLGNRIDFDLQITENSYVISIDDNGPGIPEAYINKVQDPLFSSTLHLGSLGIGLSIATNISQEVLGGNLSISNRPEGGIRVRVTIQKLSQEDIPTQSDMIIE